MIFPRKQIYFDNTATTRVRREVIREMRKYYHARYGNPSSIHKDGLVARGSIEMARERIAAVLGCHAEEIIFTGSGSESNNLAITGSALSNRSRGNHIITSPIEHKSALNTCRFLEEQGFEISYVPVTPDGKFLPEQLAPLMRDDTILVSLGFVNNEIGTVQNLESLIPVVRQFPNCLLHIDGVQALPYFAINLHALDVDLMSFSGHKLYAPKGVGILYKASRVNISPIIFGGEQEYGIRSGTENIPYIVGLSRAIQLNHREKTRYVSSLASLRDTLIKGISAIPDCVLTGSAENRAPNHVSFCFKDINGKMLVKELSLLGFDVSSGSACSSPKNTPSHVLEACGIDPDYLHGSLRITVGHYNTARQVKKLLRVLPQIIRSMRDEKYRYYNDSIFISKKDFIAKLESNEELQIIDVRPYLYPKRMIDHSIHIPSYKIKSRLKDISKDKEIILVCYEGDIISPYTQQLLFKKGYRRVKVLQGGIFSFFGEAARST
ncbi:MAG: aminotransferase class V-fold PLP-dependent enzyme [bacterium]|nr:aminotransferase class V-fold PLP-dependent enzyme [bacterium]